MTNRKRQLELVKQAKAWLKNQIAWPGGYTIGLYLLGGDRICKDCALDNWASIVHSTLYDERDGWAIMGLDVHWEGGPEFCDCGEMFDSEYGNPWEDLEKEHTFNNA